MLRPRRVRLALVVVLTAAIAIVTSGCDGTSGSGQSGATGDFSFLDGTWVIDQTLATIDNETRRPIADLPEARWECTVDGDTMTIQTLTFRYEGQLSAEGDGWAYKGSTEFQDDKGDLWTSTIEVHATMDGQDRFGGTLGRSVDSELRGHDYAATWSIVGERFEP